MGACTFKTPFICFQKLKLEFYESFSAGPKKTTVNNHAGASILEPSFVIFQMVISASHESFLVGPKTQLSRNMPVTVQLRFEKNTGTL